MRKLRAAGEFAALPDPGASRRQSLDDANVAAAVQLDTHFFEADTGGVRDSSCRDQEVAALNLPLAGSRAHGHAHLFPRSALHVEGLRLDEESDAFVGEKPLHLVGDVTVLATHDLRAGLDDGHAAAEATIGLGHFQADIATAEHDEVRRQGVELQDLNMGKGPGRLQTGNGRNCGVRADIDDDLAAGQHALATFVEGNFDFFRRNETSASHDELGTAGLIGVEVESDFAVDHVLFAAPNLRHSGRNCAGLCAELSGVAGEMRGARAPDLVLTRQTSDGGTGATDPTALDHNDPLPRSGQMPGEQLAALSAAQDQEIVMSWLGHDFPPLCGFAGQPGWWAGG